METDWSKSRTKSDIWSLSLVCYKLGSILYHFLCYSQQIYRKGPLTLSKSNPESKIVQCLPCTKAFSGDPLILRTKCLFSQTFTRISVRLKEFAQYCWEKWLPILHAFSWAFPLRFLLLFIIFFAFLFATLEGEIPWNTCIRLESFHGLPWRMLMNKSSSSSSSSWSLKGIKQHEATRNKHFGKLHEIARRDQSDSTRFVQSSTSACRSIICSCMDSSFWLFSFKKSWSFARRFSRSTVCTVWEVWKDPLYCGNPVPLHHGAISKNELKQHSSNLCNHEPFRL